MKKSKCVQVRTVITPDEAAILRDLSRYYEESAEATLCRALEMELFVWRHCERPKRPAEVIFYDGSEVHRVHVVCGELSLANHRSLPYLAYELTRWTRRQIVKVATHRNIDPHVVVRQSIVRLYAYHELCDMRGETMLIGRGEYYDPVPRGTITLSRLSKLG